MEEMYSCAKVQGSKVTYTKSWNKLRGNLSTAKNYAFYTIIDENTMQLSYRQYYMTDPGKFMILSHYGDWEGCEIIFKNENGEWKPVTFSFNHHGINTTVEWNSSSVQKSGNHPIIFAARGSHGIYLNEGIHQYRTCLFDSTNYGKVWRTTNSLESYYYSESTGLISIEGTNHVYEFTTINKWGQSFNSPDCLIVEDVVECHSKN